MRQKSHRQQQVYTKKTPKGEAKLVSLGGLEPPTSGL